MTTALFWFFALLTGGSALLTVFARDIVRMAVCLLFTLGGVAGVYFLLGSEFLAGVQLVVYVGGTLILIVFGVMLTSRSAHAHFRPTLAEVSLAITLAVVLMASLLLAYRDAGLLPATERAATASDTYPVRQLGQALLSDDLAPFELVSVILLVVMIGAAYLAKGRRRPTERSE